MTDQTATPDRQVAIDAAGWGSPVKIVQTHNPAFWLYAATVTLGVWHLSPQIKLVSHQYMTAVVTGVLLWSLYVLP